METAPHHDGSELYVERDTDSATLRLRAAEGAAETVLLRYVEDGETRLVEAVATGAGNDVWWSAEVPLRGPVVRYRWLLTGGRAGYLWVNGTGAHAHEVTPGADFKLTADPLGPDWHLSSVVYEVFLDRFASSGAGRVAPSWAVPRAWDRLPAAHSRTPHLELFGGDLAGVEQHLEHVESLGANVIYLTPFFPAGSNHRYDPTSFDRVDPFLGDDDALISLVRAARARGLRLVGDLSLDHPGMGHDWFVRARTDESAPERAFFLFDRSKAHGYEGWLGYKEMPRFDWRSEELRVRMGAAVRRWLEAGLAGWRIGAASSIGRFSDVDLNAEVARWARAQCGDALLVADCWHDFERDVDGLGWHGVMNYSGFLRPVWWWLRDAAAGRLAHDVFLSTPAPSYTGTQAAMAMTSARSGLPWDATLQSWLLLDSHDTPRFGEVTGSRERQLVGVGLQMTMPGVPMIFAGGELGLGGTSGYDARRTIPWEHRERWDERLLTEYRRLTALRRSCAALARGGLRYVHVSNDAIAYLRETASEQILCLAARAPHAPIATGFAELETLYGGDAREGVLPADGPQFHVWRVNGASNRPRADAGSVA